MPDVSNDSPNQSIPVLDDRMHPYFLHHADNPGIILVSQILTGENYSSWNRAMRIALDAKNKTGFVDGTLRKPDDRDPVMVNAWMRNNSIVMSWILNSVSKEIAASVMFAETAYEIWTDLSNRFRQRNGPKIFKIKREIMSLAQNQESVAVYFTKLKSIWEELAHFRPHCSCGRCECGGEREIEKYFQIEHVMHFLMGLDESYSQMRGQVLLMDPLPPINRVFSLVVQEEQQQSITRIDQNSVVAFSVEAGYKKGSTAANSRQGNKNNSRERPFCSHCKMHGHIVDRCYKVHGYPIGYKPKQRNNSSSSESVNVSFGSDLSTLVKGLSSTQCQQLMSAIASQMVSVNVVTDETGQTKASSGCETQEDDFGC